MYRWFPALALLGAVAAAEDAPLRHEIVAEVSPDTRRIVLTDRITGAIGPRFTVHAGLSVTAVDGTCTVRPVGDAPGGAVPRQEYELGTRDGVAPVLRLEGEIHHPLEAEEQEYARSFSRSPGLISEQGVVLSGATAWLPQFGDGLFTFRLEVVLPEGWDAVSQGVRTLHEVRDGRRRTAWECAHPMEEAYLIAARFTEYARPAGEVTAQAFLRDPDEALAAKYLEVTAQYLKMYRRLLGPYPFGKFALVENFWETGYGMPSFTLLGPRIIRFPFILHSSYPHEILHNWWGNGVYVDWEKGNWCEGLTAYLADHLIREGQGQGEAYRRDTLKKYRDYVRDGNDFPLVQFRSRHSSATEAVGYGKSLMLFHMLRMRLGDDAFTRGLRDFYRRFRFRVASWDDLATAFPDELRPFFRQWTERAGAPALEVAAAEGGFVLRQVQEGEPFDLVVPVAITTGDAAELRMVPLKGRETVVALPEGATRVDVDPAFDVFRMLDRREVPPTLGEIFGAERVTIVLPQGAPAWEALADAWKGDQVRFVREDALERLPPDRAVWILGGANRWSAALQPELEAREAERDGPIRVFAARHPGNPELAAGWIVCDVDAALPGLARKLPHYGKYSWLAFEGDEPTNVGKGQWDATDSPLVLHPKAARGMLAPRAPLARLAPVFDPKALLAHVRFLADDAREGRGIGTRGLDDAADYIGKAFAAAGLETHEQRWTEKGGPGGRDAELRNVIAVLPGTDPALAGESVVLGAHYDHLGRGWPDVRAGCEGQLHNGADDNASGVAVLLEVAALLAKGHKPQRTIVFVAFSGEEWGLKGSRHYVGAMERWPAAKCRAMVNLDTVGRLGSAKLTVLGSGTASEWIHIAMGVGWTTGVEATCVAHDPGGSDQVAFHEAGVPAVQLFTGPHEDYHRPTDDVDKVDADGLVKVATFVRETLVYLGDRKEPLTSSLGGGRDAPPPPRGEGRRVSLGCMPDFTHAGPGVKVQSVIEGSPAAAAGIRPGDLLLAFGDKELKDLRALSEALKAHAAGDRVRIRLRRGEEDLELEAELTAR